MGKNVTNLSQLKLQTLSAAEKNQVKGGLAVYCEEKRRQILGMSYTGMQMYITGEGGLTNNRISL